MDEMLCISVFVKYCMIRKVDEYFFMKRFSLL